MANVSVLLHLGQRKKVVKIPSSCSDHYALLCETVVEWAGETVQYFVKYDADWDDWIELEKGFAVCDKDRVRAVVYASSQANQRLEGITCNASTLLQHNSKVCARYS